MTNSSSNDLTSGASGDSITVGDVNGYGIVIGKNIKIGSINIDTLHKELKNIPNEYSDSLKAFSNNLNEVFQKYQVPDDITNEIKKTIVTLGKEIESVTPGKEKEINYVKQAKIEYQISDLADKVLNVMPTAIEIVSMFTPLSPFSKFINKGVEQIVNAVKEKRSKK